MGETWKPNSGTTRLMVGVLLGWILGQLGLVGLILAGIGCGVIAFNHGYRVVIEKDNEPKNGGWKC